MTKVMCHKLMQLICMILLLAWTTSAFAQTSSEQIDDSYPGLTSKYESSAKKLRALEIAGWATSVAGGVLVLAGVGTHISMLKEDNKEDDYDDGDCPTAAGFFDARPIAVASLSGLGAALVVAGLAMGITGKVKRKRLINEIPVGKTSSLTFSPLVGKQLGGMRFEMKF